MLFRSRDQAPFSGGEHLFEGIEDANLLALARERGANKLTELTYKHFQKEMNLINKAFYEVLEVRGTDFGGVFKQERHVFPFPVKVFRDVDGGDGEGEGLSGAVPFRENFVKRRQNRFLLLPELHRQPVHRQ